MLCDIGVVFAVTRRPDRMAVKLACHGGLVTRLVNMGSSLGGRPLLRASIANL